MKETDFLKNGNYVGR